MPPVGRPRTTARRFVILLTADDVEALAFIRQLYKCPTDAEAVRIALSLARAQSDTPRNRPAPPSGPATSK
jgi:hypothetical protein